MYSLFYKLNERPFKLTPDLKYYYNSRPHKRAFVHMRFGLEQNDGILLLTGEKGIGKTTLILYLLDELDKDTNTIALIQKPPRQDRDFLPSILASLQIPISEYQPQVMFNTLRKFLVQQVQQNKKVLLVIDEAQELCQNCLEFIRLLSAIRLKEDGILQIVLVGNNDLESVISTKANQAFRQQIIMSYTMHPLQVSDTNAYVKYRLAVAGWQGDPQIDEETYMAIHQLTGGIPYEINRYCDRLLLLGMLQHTHHLTRTEVARLTSTTLEKLDVYEAKQQKSELTDSAKHLNNQLAEERVAEKPETPSRDYAAGRSSIEQADAGAKESIFNKESLVIVVVAYLLSFLSVVVFDKYFSDTQIDEQNMANTIAKSSNQVKIPAIIEPEADEVLEPDAVIIDEPVGAKQNIKEPVSLGPSAPESEVKVIQADVSFESPADAVITPEVEESANIDIQVRENRPTETKSVPQEERFTEAVTFSSASPAIEEASPIVSAKMELGEKNTNTKPLTDGIDDIQLNHLISRFEMAYQFGDMSQIDDMFAAGIVSNNINNKQVLIDEYQKLFSITEFRHMRIYDVEWRTNDQVAIGNGRFDASIRENGASKKQKYKGSIILHIKNQENGLEITELYYNYENL